MKEEMLLSIVTLSIPSRIHTFLPRITHQIKEQTEGKPVEWICILDNQTISTGCKWNLGIQAARGKYIAAIEDDDVVSDHYVDRLLEAIHVHDGVDCIVFDVEFYEDAQFRWMIHIGVEYPEEKYDGNAKRAWRPPWGIHAIRREIRQATPHPDMWYGDEKAQAQAMAPLLKTQHRIMDGDNPAALYRWYRVTSNRNALDKAIKYGQRTPEGVEIKGGRG